jgi:hypothetical protein
MIVFRGTLGIEKRSGPSFFGPAQTQE